MGAPVGPGRPSSAEDDLTWAILETNIPPVAEKVRHLLDESQHADD